MTPYKNRTQKTSRWSKNTVHTNPCNMCGRTTISVYRSVRLIQRPRTFKRFRQFTGTYGRSAYGRGFQLFRALDDGRRRLRMAVNGRDGVRQPRVRSVSRGVVPRLSKCRLDPLVLRQVDGGSPGVVHDGDVGVTTQQDGRGVLVTVLCLRIVHTSDVYTRPIS